MVGGFIIWSICALIFAGIGISCRKSKEAAGFFTHTKASNVKDVKGYNNAVAILWFVAGSVFEIIGIPFLFLEQNSPFFVLMILAVVVGLIIMMVVYLKIEAKYRG